MSPGSRSPERVLIGNPEAGVKPMLVSMLLPSRTAARLAPLPRCARHDAAARGRRVAPAREFLQQEGVRQPMESVALHASRLVAPRNRQYRRHARHAAVKGRIEARHLRQPRKLAAHGFDEFDLPRQMLRVIGHDRLELRQQRLGHHLRTRMTSCRAPLDGRPPARPQTAAALRAIPSGRRQRNASPRHPPRGAVDPLRARSRTATSSCRPVRCARGFRLANWPAANPRHGTQNECSRNPH